MNRRDLLNGAAAAGVGLVSLGVLGRTGAVSRDQGRFEIERSPAEWRRLLTPAQFDVLREEGTEAPGSSALLKEHRHGRFGCAACDLPLFASETKYESGTGWPSFYAPLPHAVATRTDASLLMARTEVRCRRCGGHLGHVFDDGPRPTGLRYCMNGVALTFHTA